MSAFLSAGVGVELLRSGMFFLEGPLWGRPGLTLLIPPPLLPPSPLRPSSSYVRST